jgi:hypothetical protein
VNFVNEGLEFDWISSTGLDILKVAESDIFQAVDLTKHPEEVVFVLSIPLYLEVLGEVWIDGLSFCDSVQHFGLGEWA